MTDIPNMMERLIEIFHKEKVKKGFFIDDKGNKRWYKNNKLHRENDLPAIEWANGTKHWYVNGKLHRNNNLPAIVFSDGNVEYWEYDIKLTKEEIEYRQKIKILNDELHNNLKASSKVNKSPKI